MFYVIKKLKFNQKDENSLPPYSVLDRILQKMVDESLSVEEIIAQGEDKEVVERVNKIWP